MPWGRLSDDWHTHRKVRRAGLEGAAVHAMAISYAARYLTDGAIDTDWLAEVIPQEAKRERLIDRLVEIGLLDRTPDCLVVHDYTDYNPTRAELEETRRRQSEGGRKGAATLHGRRSSHGQLMTQA